jgi:hypothetical protein
MTLDADIIEHPAPAQPHAADPRIAVAEMWLCMLGGLMEVARRFSRYLVYKIMPFGAGPKAPFLALRFSGDPAAVFKRVLRTARFAAVLYLKIQKQIAAWKAGAPFDLEAFLAEAPRIGGRAKSGRDAADSDGEDWEGEEWEDLEEWENLYESENLVERERFDFLDGPTRQSQEDKYQALLRGPLKDAIAAICKDLGLKPDWSLWTEKGFPAPAGGGVEDWVDFFAPQVPAAPPPIPDWIKAVAPPCPEDEAGAKVWRRRWRPREHYAQGPPSYRSATRSPDGRTPEQP